MSLVAAQIEGQDYGTVEPPLKEVRGFSCTGETGQSIILQSVFISSLVLVNYLLFELFAALSAFSGFDFGRGPGVLLFCFLSLVQSLLVLPCLWREISGNLKGGNVPRNAIHFSIAVTITLALAYQVVIDINAIFSSSIVAYALFVHFLIAVDRFCEFKVSRFIEVASKIALDRMVRDIRIPAVNREDKTVAITVETSRWQDARALRPGDIFTVKQGEVLPCDAVVVEGVASLTERYLTGLPEPVCKGRGDEVCAGSTVREGSLVCKVVNRLEDSVFTSFLPHLRSHLHQRAERIELLLPIISIFHYAVFIGALSYGLYAFREGEDAVSFLLNVTALLFTGLLSMVIPASFFLSAWMEMSAFTKGIIFKNSSIWQKLGVISNFSLYYDSKSPPGALRVQAIEKLDHRVEDDRLYSILLSLSGSGQDEADRELARHLSEHHAGRQVFHVDNYHYYSDRGVCGVVDQMDVTLGTEEFLIERGVYLQESDTYREFSDRVRYVAFNEEVVACIHYFPRGVEDGLACSTLLQKLGIPFNLLSHGSHETLERFRKRIDVDVSGAYAELDPARGVRILEESAPVLLYGGKGLPVELEFAVKKNSEVLAAVQFNELEWSVARYDLTLFSPDLERLATVCAISSRILKMQKLLVIVSVVAAVTALISISFMGVIPWLLIGLPLAVTPFFIWPFQTAEKDAILPLIN